MSAGTVDGTSRASSAPSWPGPQPAWPGPRPPASLDDRPEHGRFAGDGTARRDPADVGNGLVDATDHHPDTGLDRVTNLEHQPACGTVSVANGHDMTHGAAP